MEILKNYVDNIFLPFKVTKTSTKLKNDILSHMEDEFIDLKENNLSNEEAIGTIITKFGSFEDLFSELEPQNNNETLSEEDEEMVKEYKDFSKLFPKLIAGGVSLCILAIAITGAISYFTDGFILPLVFFTPIAIGVALFIIAGTKKSYYIEYFKSKNLTQYYDVAEHGLPADYRNPKYRRNKILSESIQGILWLILIAVYLTLGFTKNLWHPGWVIFIIGGLLSGIIELVFNFLNNK